MASGPVGALLRSHLDKLGAAFRGSREAWGDVQAGPSCGGWALTPRGQGWPSACRRVGWGWPVCFTMEAAQWVSLRPRWALTTDPCLTRPPHRWATRTRAPWSSWWTGTASTVVFTQGGATGQARQALLHRGQLAPAGGAHGDRGDHRVSRGAAGGSGGAASGARRLHSAGRAWEGRLPHLV